MNEHGHTVYPINPQGGESQGTTVYKSLAEVPGSPRQAFVLLSRDNARTILPELKQRGIGKVLFQSKSMVDAAMLSDLHAAGIKTAYGCPMMLYGKGLHKFHALLAGVK